MPYKQPNNVEATIASLPDKPGVDMWQSGTGEVLYVGEMTGEEIQALGDRVRGGILLARPPQTRFATTDRVQPTEIDGPVPLRPPPAT